MEKTPTHRQPLLTFIGHLEAQGAAGVVCFEIEPHLVTGADHEVWSCCAGQAEERQENMFENCVSFEGKGP